MPRGPAGCARDAVLHHAATTVVVLEGSVIPRIDFAGLVRAHEESGAAVTLVVSHAAPTDADGGGEPAGIYVFSRAALEHVPAIGYHDIKEGLLPRLHAAGARVATYPVEARAVPRVSGISSYLTANKSAIEELVSRPVFSNGFVRLGEAVVHESVRLAADIRLVGPMLLEPGCRVDAGATLVGPTIVGPDCRIGEGALVSRSILWSGCTVGPGARVDHCILADGAYLRAAEAVHDAVCVLLHRRRSAFLERLATCWRPTGCTADHRYLPISSRGHGVSPKGIKSERIVDDGPVGRGAVVGGPRHA